MQKKYEDDNLLNEGSKRTIGESAYSTNINAAIAVADTVRTTLGPKGMDKMLIDSLGEITVTNDGVTILNLMDIKHPAAKMVAEVAQTQESEVGDGTTTAVVLAGEMLKNAHELLKIGVHPTIITKGYDIASKEAISIVNLISEKINLKDNNLLKSIAMTAMTGKGTENDKEYLADLAVKAIKNIDVSSFDSRENIKITTAINGSINDSEVIDGIILDKEKIHPDMPSKISKAKIALINTPLEIRGTEVNANIEITSPEQLESFMLKEEDMISSMVKKIIDTGANVIISQKGIDDSAQHLLAKAGIVAIRRVKRSDMEKLSLATGANIISSFNDLNEKNLGTAGKVELVSIGEEKFTIISKCKTPKAVTILLRGGSYHIVAEVKRAVEDVIGDLISSIKSGKIVYGASSIETEILVRLAKFASEYKGTDNEKLAIASFAKSFGIIAQTLAENTGLKSKEIIEELKNRHKLGDVFAGINVYEGKIFDAKTAGIIEPVKIKIQAITSATEVSNMILRIDDIIAAKEVKQTNRERYMLD